MDYFNNINLKCVTADWIGRYIYIYACKLKEGKVKRKSWICRKEKEHREMLNGIWWTRFKLVKLYIKWCFMPFKFIWHLLHKSFFSFIFPNSALLFSFNFMKYNLPYSKLVDIWWTQWSNTNRWDISRSSSN